MRPAMELQQLADEESGMFFDYIHCFLWLKWMLQGRDVYS